MIEGQPDMRLIEKARVAFRNWLNQPSADELDAEAERLRPYFEEIERQRANGWARWPLDCPPKISRVRLGALMAHDDREAVQQVRLRRSRRAAPGVSAPSPLSLQAESPAGQVADASK